MKQQRHPNQNLKPGHSFDTLYLDAFEGEKYDFFRNLIQSNAFISAQNEREQVNITRQYANEANVKLSIGDLAIFFGINKGNIFRQIKQWKKSPHYLKIGRPDIFGGNKEAKDFVHKIANQRFIDCDPIGYQEILEQLHQKYSLCIKKNSLYKYIARNSKHSNSS